MNDGPGHEQTPASASRLFALSPSRPIAAGRTTRPELGVRLRTGSGRDLWVLFNAVYSPEERMRALIEDLLASSRAGRSERPLESVDTARVVGEVACTLRALAHGTPPVIEWDGLPVVKGDSTQLVQLFQNLIGNGGEISVAPRDGGGSCFTFTLPAPEDER